MLNRAREIAERIRRQREIKIVTHIDADGICAGSIASKSLEREGIAHEIEFVKQLDNEVIGELKDESYPLIWFTDLGSGSLSQLREIDAVITDHHEISERIESERVTQLNPHAFKMSGAVDISGAGVTYLVARALSKENMDLSPLAIIGAVGDLQDLEKKMLVGMNREILSDGKRLGLIDWKIDIRFFGRETRPIFKLLQYASDPIVVGLSGKEENCIQFLQSLRIAQKDGERWRRWIDLSKDERQRIVSEIVVRLIEKGFGHEYAKRVVGEVYLLTREEQGTELRDAKEFATLLNACGRYENAEIGYRVCLGDREESFERARILLQGHRRSLVDAIQLINELGILRRERVQYFYSKDKINENIIGIVAGMILGSGEIPEDLPIIGFAETENGLKVSARSKREIVKKGLDLAIVMRKASEKVGGYGGGHNIAAGAFIPKGCEEEFLDEVERLIKEQLGS